MKKATKTQSSIYTRLFWELQLNLKKSENKIKINTKSGIDSKNAAPWQQGARRAMHSQTRLDFKSHFKHGNYKHNEYNFK